MKTSKVIAIEKLNTGSYSFIRFFAGGEKRYGAFTTVTDATYKRILQVVIKYKQNVKYHPDKFLQVKYEF